MENQPIDRQLESLRSDIAALSDRVNDLETHVIAKIDRQYSRQREAAYRMRLLFYGLFGLVVLAVVGLRLDNGNVGWSYNDVAVTQLFQVLGVSGVAGFGTMAIAGLQEKRDKN